MDLYSRINKETLSCYSIRSIKLLKQLKASSHMLVIILHHNGSLLAHLVACQIPVAVYWIGRGLNPTGSNFNVSASGVSDHTQSLTVGSPADKVQRTVLTHAYSHTHTITH